MKQNVTHTILALVIVLSAIPAVSIARDQIQIVGEDTDGSPVSGTFTFGAVNNGTITGRQGAQRVAIKKIKEALFHPLDAKLVLRELKLAAAAALAGIPGDDAVGALAQAAQARDAQLRRAAQTALDRRAQALARRGEA